MWGYLSSPVKSGGRLLNSTQFGVFGLMSKSPLYWAVLVCACVGGGHTHHHPMVPHLVAYWLYPSHRHKSIHAYINGAYLTGMRPNSTATLFDKLFLINLRRYEPKYLTKHANRLETYPVTFWTRWRNHFQNHSGSGKYRLLPISPYIFAYNSTTTYFFNLIVAYERTFCKKIL